MADAQTTTLPDKNPPPAKVFRKTLPCYVLLVHGVNDAGEAYKAQEEGLCWGLSERLGRNYDMQPYEYKVPGKDRRDPLESVPDRIYYRRVEGSSSHSPVIPFYWGFREEDGKIDKGAEHGEWLDRDKNRLDHDGAKSGGAFVNAANCLPHMWAPGWKPPAPGTNALASLGDKTHPMLKAPHRRYQVLAALRLAMLIRILRKRHPEIAINVVAHSMGCLVALLAQAYLLEDDERPVDCIIMNNPPYSFEENAFDHNLFKDLNQTSRARIETLQRIVKAFHEKRAKTPTWRDVQDLRGLAGPLWGQGKKLDRASGGTMTFAERDNRGKIYLYFTPHDRTVALLNTQGIGWQGVPDRYQAFWTEEPTLQPERKFCRWDSLMDELHVSGFRQRIFLQQLRGGKPFQVGLPPQHVSLREEHDRYPSWWKRAKSLDKAIPMPCMRRINGEPLNPPVDYSPGDGMISCSPIDAAIALTNGATEIVEDSFDDPRQAHERPPVCPFFNPSRHWEALRSMLNQGRQKEDRIGRIHAAIEIRDEQDRPTGRLWLRYEESPNETRRRLQTTWETENSFHSSIVSHPWHSQAVTAYDLAVSTPIRWSEREKKFYEYACLVADWRIKSREPGNPNVPPLVGDKLNALKATGFFSDEEPIHQALINATATYYIEGTLPSQVDQARTPDKLSLIHFETTGKRAPMAG